MTIHDLDMARWLLGEEPVEVTAHGSCLVDPAIGAAGDIDTAAVTLRTASGRIAQVANTRRAVFGYDQRIEVCGARGMLAAGNRKSTSVERATAAGYATDPGPALLPRTLRRRLPPRARRLRAPPARRGRRHRLGRRRRARARDSPTPATGRCAPAPPSSWRPVHEAASRRPDRQRLHRPRARDRAAGSRGRVPGRGRRPCARCSRTATRRRRRSPPRPWDSRARPATGASSSPIPPSTSSTSARRTTCTARWRSPRSPPASTSGARSRSRSTRREATEVADAAARAGVVHLIGFNYSLNPLIRLAQAMIAAGEHRHRHGLQRAATSRTTWRTPPCRTAGAASAALRAPARSRTSART